jgi:hypothetical protein
MAATRSKQTTAADSNRHFFAPVARKIRIALAPRGAGNSLQTTNGLAGAMPGSHWRLCFSAIGIHLEFRAYRWKLPSAECGAIMSLSGKAASGRVYTGDLWR